MMHNQAAAKANANTNENAFEVIKESREDRMLAALTAEAPREITELFIPTRMAKKSVLLPSTIRRSLAVRENNVVMFTSAYAREDAPGVAFQAARSAAMQSTGKVLYVHVSRRLPRFFRDIHDKIPITLDEFIESGGGGSVLPFVVLDESGLVCAWYRGPGETVNPEGLRVLTASLRRCFEFTVFGGDDMLCDGASAAFADLVDGTVLVTEAERTRVPVAKRLKRAVEENGGNVIGAILNRRKFHIPEWIYRILYGGSF